ncbi:LacI family transcriptional regulator [Arthrobacter sp. PvP102]|jgi:LacI family transcriptional regulator|uniref:LacI family DNA-binding transcriptional regulator n=1 Tax=unclassified Arthrobacter TaxID=235627 RepID=UPI0000526EC6|nr:transcriptional regulator, LacI family [Arthrobacter sp. FB24]MBP1234035.1 LacI family transcriptional regulator [Arthrobacter sp. PvP103]MBP1239169.1 LacI family transcriptional regulator [Arthrobacter sp. PvP102]
MSSAVVDAGDNGAEVRRPPAEKMPTIKDVAELAGVATSTVSRALSKPDRVNRHTRERIEEAAARLNYVPSSQARGLSSGRTDTVAVLVPDITNPFYFDIIRGTQHQLKAAGLTQLLVDTEESSEMELEALHKMRRSADGFILAASRLTDAQLADVSGSQPLVTINRASANAPTVVIDTPSAMIQALEHLASLGHHRICYVSGPPTSWSNLRRWKIFEEDSAHRGLETHRIGPFTPKTTSGAAAADAAVRTGATACIVFNDLLAIGMLQRLRERGIRVPEDMSIVGCDDIFGADFCNPPLTTISSPIEQAGRVAVSMLLSQLNPLHGGTTRRLAVMPTHLTVRGSTGPAPEPGVR